MARFGRRYIPWKARKPPGPLATTNAISGTCDLAFTTSGTVTGAGALTGSSLPTFATSGAMTAGSLIVGTCDTTITPSGTLVGAGALAGSCALDISLAADMGNTSARTPGVEMTLPQTLDEFTLPIDPEFLTMAV